MTTYDRAAMLPRKAYRGMAMEGGVARWYAKLVEGRADYDSVSAMLAPLIPSCGRFLEVAPGPGYHTIQLAQRSGAKATGLDISETFVGIARENAARAGVPVDFRVGNASLMPFEDASFDLVVCMAAFKNFTAPVNAMAEVRRVLKPGGVALIEDMRRDAEIAALDRETDAMGLSAVNAFMTKLTFRWLRRNAHTVEQMRRMGKAAGFTAIRVDASAFGMNVWLGDDASRFPSATEAGGAR